MACARLLCWCVLDRFPTHRALACVHCATYARVPDVQAPGKLPEYRLLLAEVASSRLLVGDVCK